MAKKLSAADAAQAHQTFMATLAKELPSRGLSKLNNRVKRDGAFARRQSARQYQRYLADGGKAGDWKAFAEWLIKNLPTIIALLMTIFA